MNIKSLLAGCSLLLALAISLPAQDASADELKRAEAYLEQTRDTLLSATADLSDAQLTFKPTPERWSVADVMEHLAATESFLMTMVQEKAMQAPPRAEPVNLEEIDALILARIPDRSKKFQATEPLAPTNRFGSPAEARKQFEERRAATLKFLRETSNLRGHAVDSPLGHQLDPYQWLLFIGAHSERHTKQIEEVKADPGFPAR